MNLKKIFSILVIVLGISQVLLILVSWLISAAMPELLYRSLLSSEGIRWFLGNFVDNLATPLLVWMVLLSLAFGIFHYSGLQTAILSPKSLDYPKRFAFHLVILEFILFVLVILALTIIPHAILLSVTGTLFPSSFSKSIIPVVCFVVLVLSSTYGVVSGNLHGTRMLLDSMTKGFLYTRPFFLLYVLGVQLYFSVLFVFNLGNV